MPFRKIQSEKVADAVVTQIELLILRGILRPGERLPSERNLSYQMGVSRPTLREAVAELESRGLLQSRAGSGIYIDPALGQNIAPALTALFSRHAEAIYDYIDFRRDIEGMAIERAARFGSDTDLKVVDTVLQKMATDDPKRTAEEDARLDAAFHMSIVEAGHNVVMLHMMRSSFELLEQGVFFNRQAIFRQKAARETLHNQHCAINDALQARDAARARAALETHLDYIAQALVEQDKAVRNEAIAQQRGEHEHSA